jgi:hypothetical protein
MQKTELQHLINDSKDFFKQSVGEIDKISGEDTIYTCKIGLNGKLNGSISFKSGKTNWAEYSVYLVESSSLKDVRSEALFWRQIIRSIAPSYTEEVKEGTRKNIHGKPEYEYLFTKIDAGRKNWINVVYAKDKKAYYLYFSVGWQDWF